MVGRRSFPFGMAFWQVQTVSLMECIFLKVSNSYHPCMVFTNISHKNQPNARINQMLKVIQLIRSMPGVNYTWQTYMIWYDILHGCCNERCIYAIRPPMLPHNHKLMVFLHLVWSWISALNFEHFAPQLTDLTLKNSWTPVRSAPNRLI